MRSKSFLASMLAYVKSCFCIAADQYGDREGQYGDGFDEDESPLAADSDATATQRLRDEPADEPAMDLLELCVNGDVDAARLLLDNGAEVDRANQNGATPLHIACCTGHVDLARLLLDNGAEVNRAMKDGATPLLIACYNGHVDAARLLLDNGAEVNRATTWGTPLSAAKSQGRSSIVALLEEHQK